MMVPWLSFITALAGFGLVSLTMQRHSGAWTEHARVRWQSRGGKMFLALVGAAALIGSGIVALHDNLQLGAVYWSAYLMAAALFISGLHAYAERWAVRIVLLASMVLLASITVAIA